MVKNVNRTARLQWKVDTIKTVYICSVRNLGIDTPINIPISEKPLVANLGVFHISHKCQGLENSTLYTQKITLNL